MYKNKLYSILTHFDKIEQNRLRKYLISPYFNKNETLVSLFELMIIHVNKQHNQDLDKIKVWNHLFLNVPFDDVRYRKLFSDLLKLVEGFLAQQVYDKNPINKATHLIEAVGHKKLDKLYKSSMKTARKLSNIQLYRSADYYYQKYQIERNYYEMVEFGYHRTSKKNLEEIGNNLDRFYITEKLKYHCAVLNQQNIIALDYNLPLTKEIISIINKYDYSAVPSIAVYNQIYLTLIDSENEEHYFKLKELLIKYGSHFPQIEAFNIYDSTLNYCIRKINKGKQRFLHEYFELYVDFLDKEIIFIDGELGPLHFKNIIVAALRLKKFEWTTNFIENYKVRLPESFRDNAVTFNLARLNWYQKKHDEVIKLLREVEYEDVTYNLSAKVMLTATYYETDEIEPLYSLLESFRAYLNRHKEIPSQRRRNYLNLIKFTKKLTKVIPGDTKAISKLQQEIDATGGIMNKDWLMEKIAELE